MNTKNSEMKKIYQKPEVEVFEFEVENGFAQSFSNSTTERYGDGGDLWNDTPAGSSTGTDGMTSGSDITWDF